MTAYAAEPVGAAGPLGTLGAGALQGVRVLELGQLLAGPYCAQLLADHGADVVKLEDPQHGDVMRQWGQKFEGRSLWWPIVARNKRCVTADLRTPEGRSIARSLAADVDIVIENFRPGTMERWGLDHETLAAEHPELIMVRISGYGQTGPLRPPRGVRLGRRGDGRAAAPGGRARPAPRPLRHLPGRLADGDVRRPRRALGARAPAPDRAGPGGGRVDLRVGPGRHGVADPGVGARRARAHPDRGDPARRRAEQRLPDRGRRERPGRPRTWTPSSAA